MRAALYWAQFLKAAGVPRIFGHPGTESIELLEAADEVGLPFILTHHEATSGFAASMTGRLTGTPGVCVTTAGPGATNVASAIAQATLDRMPLLAVTGDHTVGPGQPLHQRLSPTLYGPITKATVRLTADSIERELPRAWKLAAARPQGAVHVTFPSDQMTIDVGAEPGTVAPPVDDREEIEGDLGAARSMIAEASRPFLIAGLGVPAAGVEMAFRRLAETLDAPVADTPQGRGSYPTDGRRYVGTFATHRDAEVAAVANASDLIITVGLDSVEFLKKWGLTPPVLALSDAVGWDDPAIPATATLIGPLDHLLAALADTRPASSWADDLLRRTVAAAVPADPSAVLEPAAVSDSSLRPQEVVDALRRELPVDGIVSVDVGSHKLLMVRRWQVSEPGTFLNSSGISSMGTGLPFALAAKLAYPKRQVVAVIGDGGFLMYAGELATLARLRVPVLVVVMADAALYSIKIKQVRRHYRAVGTEFPGIQVAEIARAFGVDADRVATSADFSAAVRRALGRSGPTVVEAVIDPAGYALSQ